MGNWLKAIGYVFVAAILTRWIPFHSFFQNVDTMVHESGHAAVTLLLSGKVMRMELYVDHSGVTQSVIGHTWAMVPVGLAGYMTASLVAWWLFVLRREGRERQGLAVLSVVAAVDLLVFVRNGFGESWLAGFLVCTLLVLLLAGKTLARIYFLVIAFLSLTESVLGAASLIIYAAERPSSSGDAALLAQTTGLPAMLWSIWFTGFALWCAKKAIEAFRG